METIIIGAQGSVQTTKTTKSYTSGSHYLRESDVDQISRKSSNMEESWTPFQDNNDSSPPKLAQHQGVSEGLALSSGSQFYQDFPITRVVPWIDWMNYGSELVCSPSFCLDSRKSSLSTTVTLAQLDKNDYNNPCPCLFVASIIVTFWRCDVKNWQNPIRPSGREIIDFLGYTNYIRSHLWPPSLYPNRGDEKKKRKK